MRTISLFAILLVGPLKYFTQPSLSVQTKTVDRFSLKLPQGATVPRFQNGFVTVFDGQLPPTITVFNHSGRVVVQRPIEFRESKYVSVTDVAVSATGRIAVAGNARNATVYTEFIAWLDKSGKIEFVVRSDVWGAGRLAFAKDGSLWAVGGPVGSSSERQAPYLLVHHYDTSGRLIAESIPSATFTYSERVPLTLDGLISVGSDRIVIALPRPTVIVELGYDGVERARWSLPSRGEIHGLAVLGNGRMFAAIDNSGFQETAVYEYRPRSGKWKEVDVSELRSVKGRWLWLLGGDNDSLVVTNDNMNVLSLQPPDWVDGLS